MKSSFRSLTWSALVAFACGCAALPEDEPVASQASPLFTNGGFETNTFASWNKASALNNTGLAAVPPATTAQLQLTGTGTDFTFTRMNAVPLSQLPPGLVAQPGVPRWPRFGTTSAVVNEYALTVPAGQMFHQGANNNVNSVRQAMATTPADIDPADGKVHVRFVLAPELEAAGHVPSQQPYFFVVIRNTTAPRAQDLYTNFNFANQPGVPWSSQGVGAAALLYTDWQIFDVVPPDDKFVVGDTLEAEVFAAGCQPGGHSGSVYLDGFGAQIPSLAIAKVAPSAANLDSNITYTFTVENNTSGIAPNVVADEVLPPNTTFVAINAPGATCVTPAVGATGTVSCTYGWLNPGAKGVFTVTVHNFPAITQGTATTAAANATRLDDTTQAWAVNAFVGRTVFLTGGQGAGQQRVIASNTATRLQVIPNWTTVPNLTTTYKVVNPPAATGTAQLGTATTLTDATATWNSNQFLGWTVTIVAGTGAGQQAEITSNTATQLVVTPNWATNPNATSVYVISQPVTSVVNGNYGVQGPTVTRLLGPKRETLITNGVVYTDLGITVSDGTPGVIWGGPVTYTITITNNGPSAITNAVVTDAFPAQLATHNWTCGMATGGGTCTTAMGNANINNTVTLPVGASVTFTVVGTIMAGAGNGLITNTAAVATPAGVTDNFPGNNAASDQDGISTTLHTLTVGKDPAGSGQGTITSIPGAIDCGPACTTQTASFADTPVVTLYAVAVPNNTFEGWGGDCAASGTALTCTISVTAARNVTARFSACGNGILNAGEGCDDGNRTAGDGCNNACLVETTRACNAAAPGLIGSPSCASGVCDSRGNPAPGICEPAATCGNGVREAGEGCDDGNTAAGDGCNATCKIENTRACNGAAPGLTGAMSCASGICDATGNPAPGVCEPPTTCGNSVLEAGEGCDDGNTTAGDGCNATCKIESPRACNANAAGAVGNASCASNMCDMTGGAPGLCRSGTVCGNGVREAGEGCDDNNLTPGDGCSATCLIENTRPCNAAATGLTGNMSCASGVCDTTGNPAPGVCEPAATCGNGVREAAEGCDDGNLTAGDGCNATCKIENARPCNAAVPGLAGNLSCASGVCDTTGNPAPGVCEPATTCGNGVREPGEGCDDGNTAGGDGCNATCKIENTRPCNATAPGSTGNASCASNSCDLTGGAPGVCKATNVCGNGMLEAGEGCDDNNTTAGDGCSATCLVEDTHACNAAVPGLTGAPSCASGVCDTTGNAAPGLCEPANGCGNGVREAGEGCDDGNTAAGDGCNATCKIENTRACNASVPGATGDASCASNMCDLTGGAPGVCKGSNVCGNGVLEAGEGCDDSNTTAGDGCNAACLVETTHPCNATAPGATGNLSCASGQCDLKGNAAPGVCEPAKGCGNGLLEAGEGCDDGNTAAGDGCNASCKIESPKACNADPAGATGDASCASNMCDVTGGTPGVCAQPVQKFKVSGGGGCDASGGGAGGALPVLVSLALLGLWRRRRVGLGGLLALAVLAAGGGSARAQAVPDVESFSVERLRLAMDRDGLLDVEWGGVPAKGQWNLNAWVGDANDPLVLKDASTDARVGSLVATRIGGSLAAAVPLARFLEVGIEVPLVYYQTRADHTSGAAPTTLPSLSSAGLGDLRLVPKLALLRGATPIALIPALSLPTAGKKAYRGDASVVFAPELVASHAFGAVRLSANGGVTLRKKSELIDLTVQNDLFVRAGLGYRFGGPRRAWEADVTLHGTTALASPFAHKNANAMETDGALMYDFKSPITALAGGGVGLNPGFATPDWRVFVGVRVGPRSKGIAPSQIEDDDPDHDGIVGDADKCPLDPEDKDSFEDADGCPDPDNDKDKILDVVDKCPLVPETVNNFEDADGCPDVADTDHDGISDDKDECPNDPEDKDGFEDVKGCPDPDNDKDTVLDVNDACINEPGPVENKGCPDKDRDGDTVIDRLDNCPDEPGSPKFHGCKEKQLAVIGNGKIDIIDSVFFETDKDVIKPKSFKLLDNVAQVIVQHAEITKVVVEGHTDNVGKDEHNLDLSRRRAASVVAYLVGKGVDGGRLDPEGFGSGRPIASNKNAKGRAKNRRVVFVIPGADGTVQHNDTQP